MMKKNKFNFIRYSNCWEDTEIMLQALNVRNKVCASIASAGDNTLAMLIDNPKKIYAFDINKTQLYCTELKIACFKCLSYEETLRMLGVKKESKKNRKKLYNKISKYISKDANIYFNTHKSIVLNGIIHCGKFENYFRIFRKTVIPLFSNKKTISNFVSLSNQSEQIKFYDEKIDNKRFKTIFKIFFGYKVMGKLGRDKTFYKYVDEKEKSGSDIKQRFRNGISNTINKTNPYLNYIINGNFNENCLPVYLKEENFEIIRNNINKIELVYGTIQDINHNKIDCFNLSDIFEYMSEKDFENNIKLIESKSNNKAVITYWNMQNKRYINDSKFILDNELSKSLFKRNKSYFYRDFLVYCKEDKNE